MTEGDQLLDDLVVQLARQPRALGLLGGAERGNVGVLAAQPLFGMCPQHVDRPAQILNDRRLADTLAEHAQVAVRHRLGTALQGAQNVGRYKNLIHAPSVTRSA
jgi:hypothetical protein